MRCTSVADHILQALAQVVALPHAANATVIVARLRVAALPGALVGWNRERKRRSAGLKTHTLVSTGSALFVLAPLLAGVDAANTTRVIQGIVSGIGFPGAGAILKMGVGERVKGRPRLPAAG